MTAQTTDPAGNLAPKPLFRDPIHDGAADPTLIWNRERREWWMFYTNRRADAAGLAPKDVSWVHGTRIGIAVSRDYGATWLYHGVARIRYGKPDYTQWAPDIVYDQGKYHMFLTIVPGPFKDWNAPRHIVHFVSGNLEKWRYAGKVDTGSDRILDPSLLHVKDDRGPENLWRIWYKDELDQSHIDYADSSDLNDWQPKGPAIADRASEGPKVFRWHNQAWMIVDTWKGLAVYRSADLVHWTPQPENILATAGSVDTDRTEGHHCDVVVSGDRAFLFYFTEQKDADLNRSVQNSERHTVLQVAELREDGGVISVDRDAPVHVYLRPPAQKPPSRFQLKLPRLH